MIQAWTQWEGHVVDGNFRLEKYLGGSNRSGVFRATVNGRANSPATIKLIPAGSAEIDRYLARWSRAEGLSHPHLIRLVGKGQCRIGADDLLFVAMEYAEENLAEILPERALTPGEVRDLLEPTLDALSYLHGRGLVHGHLKPANLLAAGDQLKLASDGLCASGEESQLGPASSAYDPPERARGAADDVWSLGVTLAEALTQRLPHWIDQAAEEPAVPQDLPAPFPEIVRGCLRRHPEQRITIAEIAERLRPTALAPLTLPPKQPSAAASTRKAGTPEPVTPARLARPRLRTVFNRSLIGPALVAFFLVAVLFSGLGLLRRNPDPHEARTKPATQTKPAPQPALAAGTANAPQTSRSHDAATISSHTKPSPVPVRREVSSPSSNRAVENLGAAVDRTAQAGEILREVLPNVPESARSTIQGTIRVGIRVRVDSSGNVVATDVDTPGPSAYFLRLATQAAQGWRFAPAAEAADRSFVVRFAFTNTETTASANRTP